MKRTHLGTSLLALLLCLCLVLPLTQSASAAYLTGSTERTSVDDCNTSWFLLSETVYDCTSFDIEIDVEMNYNARCSNWNVWGRSGRTPQKLGSIYLPGGDGYASTTIHMKSGKTFDAIAVTPAVAGNYSCSFSVTADAFECAGSSSSGSSYYDSGSSSYDTGYPTDYVPGYWGETSRITDGSLTWNATPFVFDESLRGCKGFSVYLDVDMNYGAHCENWTVWGMRGSSFTKLGDLYLPGGDGEGTAYLSFRSAKNIDGIAITPRKTGSYSYTFSLLAYDVQY